MRTPGECQEEQKGRRTDGAKPSSGRTMNEQQRGMTTAVVTLR